MSILISGVLAIPSDGRVMRNAVSLLYISVEEGLGILSNELHVKSPDDSPVRRSVFLIPGEERKRKKKKEKKRAESRDGNLFRVILRIPPRRITRALKFELLDLAEVKFPPYSFLTRPIFILRPNASAARHSGSWRKKRKRQTALRDGSHSLLSIDSLTNRTGLSCPVDITTAR